MGEKNFYTEKEIELIRQMCEKKKPLKEISKALNRPEASVLYKCRTLGIDVKLERIYWSDEELEQFSEDWTDPSISNTMLRKRYKNRSMIALSSAARRLKLGPRLHDDSYLTVSDIMKEMKVSKDRVRGWIKKGLKYHKSKIKPYKYLIDEKDLLNFLEHHPDVYNASDISCYLFSCEPDWLKVKRREDFRNYNRTSGTKYSDAEFHRIIVMFKRGDSNETIAKATNRTVSAIERMLWSMGLSRKSYNQYEIDIIRKHADTHTIDEIVAMLPLRKKSGVIAKCEQLGIKYHSNPKLNKRGE